jgi:hypothetical protein
VDTTDGESETSLGRTAEIDVRMRFRWFEMEKRVVLDRKSASNEAQK